MLIEIPTLFCIDCRLVLREEIEGDEIVWTCSGCGKKKRVPIMGVSVDALTKKIEDLKERLWEAEQ